MGICDNRTVIITGAARKQPGQAYALARRRGQRGGQRYRHLAGWRRGVTPARPMAWWPRSVTAGGRAVANYEDITDWDAAGRIVNARLICLATCVVVNNAGIVRDRMFVSATLENGTRPCTSTCAGASASHRHAVNYWRAKQKRA